jgi:hypothetical protein
VPPARNLTPFLRDAMPQLPRAAAVFSWICFLRLRQAMRNAVA